MKMILGGGGGGGGHHGGRLFDTISGKCLELHMKNVTMINQCQNHLKCSN